MGGADGTSPTNSGTPNPTTNNGGGNPNPNGNGDGIQYGVGEGSVTPTGTDAASHPGRFCGHGTLFDVKTNLCQVSYEKFIESCTSDPHGPMCGNHKDESAAQCGDDAGV